MLGWLASIFSLILSIWTLITNVIFLITKYGSQWATLITHTVQLCNEYIPYSVSIVAELCVGAMVARLLYNLIRGSGA